MTTITATTGGPDDINYHYCCCPIISLHYTYSVVVFGLAYILLYT